MGTNLMFGQRRESRTFLRKIAELNWAMVIITVIIASIGFAMLYSVAGGTFEPWASRQMIRFAMALVVMIAIALTDVRVWSALAYPIYAAAFMLLVAVDFVGITGMGGQRWIDLGFMRLQPSELMKVALVLALAKYFHGLNMRQSRSVTRLAVPLLLIGLPAAFIVRQPDLGTMMLLIMGGIAVLFLAGARIWLFVVGFLGTVAAIPIGWRFMKDYQKDRILTFINPESDPLGAGYQIIQSKIALGSGGVFGKGYLQGTQSHLNFLPEMKTDFIFTVLAEEFGLVGGLFLLFLYMALLTYGALVSFGSRSVFGRLLAMGLVVAIFLYVFINIAMVMGLVPVVGVPLPLVSYGGSAMLTIMVAYGLILSVALHRDVSMPRKDPFG
ncbi:MAG: rod shape-determining protein RodA [Proteobacteria bacterium]|nr:rod shape-determining protein RodA [Pseudomonadota bacterium]